MIMERMKTKKYTFIVMAALLLFVSVVSVVYVKSTSLPTNLHQGFVMEAGEIPPQYIPEKYESKVLSWFTEQQIRNKYDISVLYDVPGTAADDFYTESLYSYANTMALFFANEEGLQLKAGDKLRFEFVMADSDADRVCVGYAKDKKISEPGECQYAAEGEQYIFNGEIEITESGEYFPYIANLSEETTAVQDLRISVIAD